MNKKRQSKDEQKQEYARYAAQRRNKLVANHLKKVLAEPGRMEQERAFADAHREDTDRQLYDYVKAEKRRLGKKLKAYSFVGYRYLVERLGPWSGIMGQVNAELRAEQQTQGQEEQQT